MHGQVLFSPHLSLVVVGWAADVVLLAQSWATRDVTLGAIGMMTAVGLAAISLYKSFRAVRREQDVQDWTVRSESWKGRYQAEAEAHRETAVDRDLWHRRYRDLRDLLEARGVSTPDPDADPPL